MEDSGSNPKDQLLKEGLGDGNQRRVENIAAHLQGMPIPTAQKKTKKPRVGFGNIDTNR